MYLHTCPQCESGKHSQCWGTKPSNPPGSYGGSKCKCQCKTVQAAQRTLDGIDMDKFWAKVIKRVAPKAAANELVRARSLSKAGKVLL